MQNPQELERVLSPDFEIYVPEDQSEITSVKIQNMCLQSNPCQHLVIIDRPNRTPTESMMDGVEIKALLNSIGIHVEHFDQQTRIEFRVEHKKTLCCPFM